MCAPKIFPRNIILEYENTYEDKEAVIFLQSQYVKDNLLHIFYYSGSDWYLTRHFYFKSLEHYEQLKTASPTNIQIAPMDQVPMCVFLLLSSLEARGGEPFFHNLMVWGIRRRMHSI